MYNDETTAKRIENISCMNGGAVISDGALDECTSDILDGVNSINHTIISEKNNSSTSYEILSNKTDSSERSTLGKKTGGNLNEVNMFIT